MKLNKQIQLLIPAIFLIGCLTACTAQQNDPIPAHDSFTIESAETSETRQINVYLPPGYSESGTTHYPVIYMPDGGIREDFPHIANTIDQAIVAGEMQAVLLVGIENTERRRDMTGPTEVAEDRKIAKEVGGSAAFRAFIASELMPRINAEYRVSDDTGIIGESAAALFIVETFFLQPDLFDKYIAISPALWWNNHELVRLAGTRLQKYPGMDIDLYLSSATETDIVPHVAQLAKVLDESSPDGLRWTYEVHTELQHNTTYRALSPIILRQFYPVNK